MARIAVDAVVMFNHISKTMDSHDSHGNDRTTGDEINTNTSDYGW